MRVIIVAMFPLLLAAACGSANHEAVVRRGLEDYVRQARSLETDRGDEDGSVWTVQTGYADAFRDVKARRLADILTIQVLESTSAVSEATTETARTTDIESSITSFAGLEKKVSELPSLFDISKASEFTGDASTSRKTVLSTTLTARILEVFPNRNLLIEGNRELLVNGERQIVTLRGVVRPNDISPSNTVLSSRIAELELEISGRGVVSDAQRPGLLYKILTGVLPF